MLRGERHLPSMLTRCCALWMSVAALAGCAANVESSRPQAFAHTERIESSIQRGVTTKADVLLLIGQPDGAGALGGFDALRPSAGNAGRPLDAWYYEHFRVGMPAGSDIELEQNVLLIFFDGDVVEGFMWFDNRSRGAIL